MNRRFYRRWRDVRYIMGRDVRSRNMCRSFNNWSSMRNSMWRNVRLSRGSRRRFNLRRANGMWCNVRNRSMRRSLDHRSRNRWLCVRDLLHGLARDRRLGFDRLFLFYRCRLLRRTLNLLFLFHYLSPPIILFVFFQ